MSGWEIRIKATKKLTVTHTRVNFLLVAGWYPIQRGGKEERFNVVSTAESVKLQSLQVMKLCSNRQLNEMAGLTLCPTFVRLDQIDSQQRTLALECYQGPVIDGRVRYGSVELLGFSLSGTTTEVDEKQRGQIKLTRDSTISSQVGFIVDSVANCLSGSLKYPLRSTSTL